MVVVEPPADDTPVVVVVGGGAVVVVVFFFWVVVVEADGAVVVVVRGGCPVVASEGRLHPVEVLHEPRAEGQPWPVATARAVTRLLDRTPGDLLVFLPGIGDIRRAQRRAAEAEPRPG